MFPVFLFFVQACSFSADGKLLASASDDQTVSLQSFLRSLLHFNIWKGKGQIRSNAVLILSLIFAFESPSFSLTTQVRVWNTETGKCIRELEVRSRLS